MYSTPPIRPRHSSTSSLRQEPSPSQPLRPSTSSRRVGLGARAPGTPIARVLGMENMALRSPRKIKRRSWREKAQEWPENVIMGLETSLSMLSLDPIAYPFAVALNGIHLLTRFSVFTAALPLWLGGRNRGEIERARLLGDVDARLEALKRAAQGSSRLGWKAATILSVGLVLLSCLNAVYLLTRRRRYHLLLRQDPLTSPNATSTTLDFSPPRSTGPLDWMKKRLLALFFTPEDESGNVQQIQQLDIWTPEYVPWSVRIFSLYPPPIALMYHFLTPSTFLPFVLTGSLLIFQTTFLIRLYTQLISDRHTLQSEVMHEYNSQFVHPRIFVQKRDMATSTNEAEFVRAEEKSWTPEVGGSVGRRRREEREREREREREELEVMEWERRERRERRKSVGGRSGIVFEETGGTGSVSRQGSPSVSASGGRRKSTRGV